MKTHNCWFLETFCVVALLNIAMHRSEAQVTLPATITSDMTLSETTTCYTADSTITIPAGITLTVNEGVKFRFRADTAAAIAVFGSLIINGTEDYPVECLLLDDTANTDTTRWGYITSSNGRVKLNYVRVSRAHRFVSAYYGTVHLNHCYVVKTYWTGTLDCVGIHYATDVLIEYCEFHGNPDQGADCVDLDSITNSGIVRHNTFCDFADDGIDIGTGSPNFLIEDNFLENCSNGITIGEKSKATFRRNIVVACRAAAIETHTGSLIIAVNNTFYNNKMGIRCDHLGADSSAGSAEVKNTIFANTDSTLFEVQELSVLHVSYSLCNTDTIHGTNNLFGEPKFLHPDIGDFSLSKDSPCINHGDAADSCDPCGTPVDIGAIEGECQGTTGISTGQQGRNGRKKIGLYPGRTPGEIRVTAPDNWRYPCRLRLYRLDGILVKTALLERPAAVVSIGDVKTNLYMVELCELNNSHAALHGKLLPKLSDSF